MNLPLVHKLVFAWFQKHGRVLPWREKTIDPPGIPDPRLITPIREQTIASYFSSQWNRNPYRILISELMLQQTQVDRVLPKFEEFLAKWPTIQDLAKAKLPDVLIAWQGLGYNRRARFLHEMAKTIVNEYHGVFPKTQEELQKLPGVGEYTARAILAFAYREDVGVIDTNIKRIFARVEFGVEVSQLNIPQKDFVALVDQAVPKGKGDPWNQALMDFGATICTARAPKCEQCPLQKVCAANLDAQHEGYLFYTQKLGEQINKKKPLQLSKKQKFEETDRYFRGRIIDKLREGTLHIEDLRIHLEKNHGLTDRLRWGLIIEKLVLDQLIMVKGSHVSLAD